MQYRIEQRVRFPIRYYINRNKSDNQGEHRPKYAEDLFTYCEST